MLQRGLQARKALYTSFSRCLTAVQIMGCMLVESRQRLRSRAEKPPPNPDSTKYSTINGRLRAEGIDLPWKDLASGKPGFAARVDRMATARCGA